MSDDAVVHLDVVLGAEIVIWKSGRSRVCIWDDTTSAQSPAARDLARTVGIDA